MPHYSDGTPAAIGDTVKGKGYNVKGADGNLKEIVGTVVGITPDSKSCNIQVAHIVAESVSIPPYPDHRFFHQKCVIGCGAEGGKDGTPKVAAVASLEYGECGHFVKIAAVLIAILLSSAAQAETWEQRHTYEVQHASELEAASRYMWPNGCPYIRQIDLQHLREDRDAMNRRKAVPKQVIQQDAPKRERRTEHSVVRQSSAAGQSNPRTLAAPSQSRSVPPGVDPGPGHFKIGPNGELIWVVDPPKAPAVVGAIDFSTDVRCPKCGKEFRSNDNPALHRGSIEHSLIRQRGAAGTHTSTGPAAPSSPRVPEQAAKCDCLNGGKCTCGKDCRCGKEKK